MYSEGESSGVRPPICSMRSERVGAEHLLAIRGDIDLANHEQVSSELARALDSDAERVVMDLSEVGFVDTTALTTLFRLVQAHGNRLVVRSPSPALRRVMQLSGLAPHFNLVD
mgnify:CR=1 FL=1